MLVLSRRLNEKIVLPNIKTSVQVVSIKSGIVRLGIEAPADITVLREELHERSAEWGPVELDRTSSTVEIKKLSDLLHQVRDQLQITSVGLGLVDIQLKSGASKDAVTTLNTVRDALQLLRFGVDGALEHDTPKTRADASALGSECQTGRTRKTARALLVEDDPNQCKLLAGFLRLAGLEVDTAGDGIDALDYLQSHERPDVVLLDMGLPRCDGPTAVREIRRMPAFAGLKIFGVTGRVPEDLDVKTGPNGIDRWFLKPLDPGMLVKELTQELNPHACLV